MKRKTLAWFFSLALIVLLIGFVSTWADNGNLTQNINGCNELNTTGATYTLTSNVSSNGTCFTITAENVTLDCNGYWINYSINGTEYGRGVYTNKFNTTIRNCNIIDGNFASSGTERSGIYLYTSTYNTVSNCFISVNNSPAIILTESPFSNLINNTLKSGNRAIHLFDTNSTLIINNTGNSSLNNNLGIHLYGICSNNTFINNTILSVSYGLLLESVYPSKGVSNNILINNTFISTESTALAFSGSDNNTIVNQIAESRGAYAIDLAMSANNIFRDCINLTAPNYEITLGWDSGTFNNTLLNCSYKEEHIPVIENWMFVKWYYQAYLNYSNGTPIAGANVTAYNSFGNIEFTTLTNSSGWISRQEVTDYNATHDGRVYYSNHTLFANKSGTFNDTTTLNITLNLNKLNYFFTLEETEDSIAPTYSLISHNSTLANYSVLFSIYINDNSALNPNGQYIFSTNNTGVWVNDSVVNFTSTPSWANVTKTLNSTVGMVVGYRWYFNDNSGNTNSTGVYTLNATSVSLFPYFTIIPDNISLFYGNDSTGVYFYGTDDSEFGYYSVNDTRFLINQSGYLTNSSALGVGNYEINVTINNTLGNINWTRYKVQINKSVSEVYLYVNNLRSNVTISNGSFIWLNGTLQNGAGIINLYNNGTLINSGSSPIYNLTQFNSTGVYNITVIYPGNENYTSDYEAWFVNSSNPISNGFNQIIANHSIVDRYENIPQYYINEVKKMLVDMGGESHSMGYQNGVNLLELYDSKFQVETYTSTPPAETDEYLRLGRPHMYGEGIWTSQTGIDDLISDIDSQNDTGNPFDVFGFGWCWDMTWENLPGGTEDPVFNVRWAGSSDGGPNGSMRWGLDSEDEALTGNVVSMDNYLDAIEQYNTYFSANNIPTVAIFTTGPVDSYTDENAFQRELKHNYIRDYILENSSRILFDYADILYYNNSGNKYTEEWNDGGDIREYAQIHPDNLLNYNSTWGMEDTGDPDSDHIGEVGALRLAKAQWWMLARISGWDGQNNTAPVTSLSFPSNGSSLFSGQITFQCNLTDDYDLKNTTLYVWNSTGNLISSNLSFNISGTSNSTNINYTINNDGNYLWNCLTYDGDSVSNFSVTNRTLIISSGVDTTPPIYNSVSHNSTSANYLVLFSVNVSDETALNNDGRYIFSTNNTGTWINESAVNFTSTPSWANVSKTLNSSVGMVVGYRWYFNDDSGNTNSTEVYTFIITEDSIPGENSCGILNVAGQTYTLTSNVSSNGTCFTISATNITLDCNGYWINYSINGTESTYGIYTDKFNTTIKNCNVVDGSNWTTGIGIERYGIYFNENDNSTLVNNFVNVSNSRAIYILGDSYFNSIINNTGNGYSEVGIYAVSLYFSLFINNTFISNSYPGMDLGSGSYNNTFINNTFISNSSSGMLIYGAHNNSLTNCTITSNNSHSLVIYYSQFNVIVDSIIQALSVGHSAIEISGSTNKTLFENVNLSSVSLDIYSDADSLDNEFVNCFYNINKESIHDTSRIIRKWYYQAYTNYSNGTDVLGVNISAYNSMGDLQFSALSNSSGLINRQEVVEYINTGGTRSYYNNYTINASLEGYLTESNVFNFTVTQNNLDDWFTLSEAADTTPPYFAAIPNHVSLFYSNQSLGVDFDANDDIEFGYFSVNDTRFLINQSGYLSNTTPLIVGNYEINVTINDTSNNLNWTRYKVQINQSQNSCSVYFNTSSPITYPNTFIAYTNCTSAYTLRLNGTAISNGTTINNGATAYNLSVQRTDTQNYTNIFNQQQFIINKNTESCMVLFNATSPLTHPNTFLVWANCTSAFRLYRNGTLVTNNSEQALAVGTYNFSMLRNDASNYTVIDNETQFTITAASDTTPPYYELVVHNSTLANYPVLFSINVSDGVYLNNSGGYIFSTNNTGLWINDSFIPFTSTPSWANVTKTLNSSVGMVVGYKWYFNDSAGNTNSTEIYTFIITSDSIPGENSCGTLDSANTVYTLTGNVSSNGTCFTITQPNITLDCNGYWINYSISEFGYGINVNNISNITIKNCNIFGGEGNFNHGIIVQNYSTDVYLFNNEVNIFGNTSDCVSIYNSTYVLIDNNTLIDYGENGHAIYSSFSAYNNITNSDIDTECYGIYLEYSSNNHNFSNLEIDVDYCAGIAINSSADNNSLSEISIFVSGYGNGIILGSDFNYLHDLDISSNIGESLKVSGYKNNITLSRFNSTNNNSVYFENGNENLFVNNTLLSLPGNVNSSLLRISDMAYNNSFYWNNFTTTGGYYINNSNSSNKFNTSVLGNAQGNEYSDIFYKRVYDSNLNGWGDDGEEYPLNSTNWDVKWGGYGQDYGPKTSRLEDLISPTYNLVSHNNTIAGDICGFKVNISDNYRLHPSGQYIFSTNNSGTWVNDSAVNFTSTPYFISTIKTLNSTLDKIIGYRWYFNDSAGNNHSTLIYTLKTEEEEEDDDSGGGGGSGDEQVVLKPSYPQIQEGYETPISKGYLIEFNLSKKGQYLADIKDVNRFTGVINFSINSTNYSVGLNNTVKINLNNDSYYDLEASVLTITFFNTSRMLFKEIHEEISFLSSPGVNETSLGNRAVVDFFGGEGKNNGFKFIYIIIILMIVILIFLVGYVVFVRLKKTLIPVEHKNL